MTKKEKESEIHLQEVKGRVRVSRWLAGLRSLVFQIRMERDRTGERAGHELDVHRGLCHRACDVGHEPSPSQRKKKKQRPGACEAALLRPLRPRTDACRCSSTPPSRPGAQRRPGVRAASHPLSDLCTVAMRRTTQTLALLAPLPTSPAQGSSLGGAEEAGLARSRRMRAPKTLARLSASCLVNHVSKRANISFREHNKQTNTPLWGSSKRCSPARLALASRGRATHRCPSGCCRARETLCPKSC